MTRINVIPVEELTDKHLIAEYRELPRVFKLARSPQPKEAYRWPREYTLGRGHVKFFYDKLRFCQQRQCQLVAEMKQRGFKPAFDPEDLWQYHERAGGHAPSHLWNDYEPTPEALSINRKRIGERLNEPRTDRA